MRPAPGKPIEAGYSRRPAMVQAGARAFCTRGVGFGCHCECTFARAASGIRRPSGWRKGRSLLLITLACVRTRTEPPSNFKNVRGGVPT